MREPELAIIVTTYQMPWHLERVLESIAAQRTSRRLEVVVSDDGSTDETPRVVEQFASRAPFPVRFLTHPHAEFQAAFCRNQGVRHSTAAHLLFIDGDCLLPPDHVERQMQFWRPGSVNCSYCVRFGPGLSQHVDLDNVRRGEFVAWAPTEELRKLRRMHYKSLLYRLIRHPTKPAFRSGNFLAAREDYLRVNGFDEQFRGWGCEDDDLGQRFRAAGIRLRSVLHRTRVYHLWHPPAPSRPMQWKQGENVAYLQRPVRLTRCLHGVAQRRPGGLTLRIMNRGWHADSLRRIPALRGLSLSSDPSERTDLELLCLPGAGRFSGRCDCQVVAVIDESTGLTPAVKSADIVLSPTGLVGRPRQVRRRLDDADGLWWALAGGRVSQQRAAA